MSEQEMSRERLEERWKASAVHDEEERQIYELARQGLELREAMDSANLNFKFVMDDANNQINSLMDQLSAANEKIEGLEQAIKITATELMDKMTEVEGGWSKIQSDLKLRVRFLNALREIVGRRMPKNKVGTPIVSDFDMIDAKMSERVEAIATALERK